MDSLSHLLALLAPRCEVNLHCRFGGRWQAGHQQMRSGVVPWHVVLRGEGRLNVGGQTHHLRAGDVVLLPHGSPHLMESLVEWGQVLPVAHRFNGTVTEMRAGPAEGALEMLCGEFYFGPHVSWLFSEASTLIHLHTDAREDCPELDALLNILVRESLAQRPGGSAIVRSLGDTLLVLLLRMLLGEQQPPGGLLRLMSDERL
ncbi:TPA: cupin domain-containing protein, partial [Klebsiella pneumoniae]